MRNISIWRCKCEISLKVITELDTAKPNERLFVICPKCRDEQSVSGYSIVSIENDESTELQRLTHGAVVP